MRRTAIFTAAATYIGTVVGAGFASGQEVLQFFGLLGPWGLPAAAIAVAGFAYFGYLILDAGREARATSHLQVLKRATGPLSPVFDLIITFFLFGALAAMIAGAGSVLRQEYAIPWVMGAGLLCWSCSFDKRHRPFPTGFSAYSRTIGPGRAGPRDWDTSGRDDSCGAVVATGRRYLHLVQHRDVYPGARFFGRVSSVTKRGRVGCRDWRRRTRPLPHTRVPYSGIVIPRRSLLRDPHGVPCIYCPWPRRALLHVRLSRRGLHYRRGQPLRLFGPADPRGLARLSRDRDQRGPGRNAGGIRRVLNPCSRGLPHRGMGRSRATDRAAHRPSSPDIYFPEKETGTMTSTCSAPRVVL